MQNIPVNIGLLFRDDALCRSHPGEANPPRAVRGKIRNARVARCRQLLADIAASRDLTVDDIRGYAVDEYLLQARKDFAIAASTLGLGCLVIGKLINRDQTMVRYYINPAQRMKRLARNRRNRLHARNRPEPGCDKAAGTIG